MATFLEQLGYTSRIPEKEPWLDNGNKGKEPTKDKKTGDKKRHPPGTRKDDGNKQPAPNTKKGRQGRPR